MRHGEITNSGAGRLQARAHLIAYFLTQLLPFVRVFSASFPHGEFFYFGREPLAALGQFYGLSTPAKANLRGGPPDRLEPACGCNSSARSINSYDIAGLILPWFYLVSHFRIYQRRHAKEGDSNYLGSR